MNEGCTPAAVHRHAITINGYSQEYTPAQYTHTHTIQCMEAHTHTHTLQSMDNADTQVILLRKRPQA